jgi:hypothetical protein
VEATEIAKLFEKLRKAAHGTLIKFDATGSGQPIEGIIFEPGPRRPQGFEAGVFVTVPNERGAIYYFDPEASKEQGRIVIQKLDTKRERAEPAAPSDDFLKEFEHIRRAPDVKIGGGAVGESRSKYKGILDLPEGKR